MIINFLLKDRREGDKNRREGEKKDESHGRGPGADQELLP